MEAGPEQSHAASVPGSGVLLVDKPAGLTSHGVVAAARRALGTRKVGHAGTLDPLATGLLVLGVGSSTRLLTWLVGADKTYETTIRLGRASTTDDAEGELGPAASPAALAAADDDAIAAGVRELTGDILQRPSAVSAIKVDGRRAYARVRDGEAVELPARPVRVDRFDIAAVRRTEDAIDVDAVVDCSSGTYIRALARDLGERLGVGGHLTALRRTRVGPLRVDDASALDADLRAAVRPAAEIAAALFPTVHLDAATAADLAHGKRIRVSAPDADTVAALAPDGHLIGLVKVAAGAARVLTNFPPEPAGVP